MHRVPSLRPLRRVLLASRAACATSRAAAAGGGQAASPPSPLALRGPAALLRSSLARAQSSVASSVAEPLPSAHPAQEQEQEPEHAPANGHHAHPESDAVTAIPTAAAAPSFAPAASVPVGAAEAFADEPPQAPETGEEREKEATHGVFPGENVLPFTSELRMLRPEGYPKHPVYRVLEPDGAVREGALEPQIEREAAVAMYGTMARLQAMDQIFYNAQRQGRVSFYMTSTGEEATHIGSAAALQPTDLVLAQYREAGVLMWRGFTLEQFADQCFSNAGDLGKGRQMPIHYGTAALHFQTISSPLATQIPQAVGAAYGMKLEDKARGKAVEERRCAVCYFGEGAASEGDFHAALNFAATLEAPVLFFCRNNGFAISTPVRDQFRGDGILSRAQGYGVHALRVDGNDLLAVFNATRAAREVCVREGKPVLLEAMTYRVGHHSTSDDSTRYRSLAEIKQWQEPSSDPLARFRRYLERKGWWGVEQETRLRDQERLAVLRALERAEGRPKPDVGELFTDVYAEKPRHLREQEAALAAHVALYPEHYGGGGSNGGH